MAAADANQQRQRFLEDLVQAVRDNSDSCSAKEAAEYAMLKVRLAVTEQKLRQQQQQQQKQKQKPVGSFSLKHLLGLNVLNVWTLILLATCCLLAHGRYYDYFDPVEKLYEAATQRCLVTGEDFLMEMSRAPVNCDMCSELRQMPVEANMTKQLFMSRYAYTARPVLIKGAVKDWKALGKFSPEFFRDLYDSRPESYKVQDDSGQFFAYKTEFARLKEALQMSEERRKKPWYFGWSNADEEVGFELRKYYDRPHFLPEDAESSKIDWMFMGVSAKGAQLHIDYVNRPSWQAQIIGRKIWELVPSPECASVCHSFNVTVHPGDIINIDTNRWYHATYVYPGDLSITIGSEYD